MYESYKGLIAEGMEKLMLISGIKSKFLNGLSYV